MNAIERRFAMVIRLAVALALAACMPLAAHAQNSGNLPQSEWAQSFDGGAGDAVARRFACAAFEQRLNEQNA